MPLPDTKQIVLYLLLVTGITLVGGAQGIVKVSFLQNLHMFMF